MKLNKNIIPQIEEPHKYDVYGKYNKKSEEFDIELIITAIYI